MKLPTFIIIALLLFIAWPRIEPMLTLSVAPEDMNPHAGRVVKDPEPRTKAPVPTPRPAPVKSIAGSAAVAVRGVILEVTPEGALVDCEARSPRHGIATRDIGSIGAPVNGSNAGLSALAASAERKEDQHYFGALQMWENGEFRDSEFLPQTSARGWVVLAGIPGKPGDTVHVLAAALGTDQKGRAHYTPAVRLQGGAWMFDARR